VKLTAVDLFCGAGGLTAGLRRAGFAVLGAIDIEPLAVRAYRANHPETALWQGDIRHLDPVGMRRVLGLEPGDLDLLAGCPPCQGFSTMRTLNGGRRVADRRNVLVMQMASYAKEFLPRAVMMENVPGLAQNSRSARLRTILRKLGYRVTDDTLNTSDFGVPQRRRRYVLIALREGAPHLAKPDSQTRTVRDLIGSLPPAGSSGDPLHDHGERRTAEIRELIASIPRDGGSRGDLGEQWQLPCHKRTDGFHDVYGRMAWDEVAPTITGGCINPSKGRFLHPAADRAITLREAALLQTFPPDYRLPLNEASGSGKYAIAELIGNALPPEFVFRHAQVIATALRKQSERLSASRRLSTRSTGMRMPGPLYEVA
jgi:DNA (cytosine-5)-methyltransferase 1